MTNEEELVEVAEPSICSSCGERAEYEMEEKTNAAGDLIRRARHTPCQWTSSWHFSPREEQ